MSKACHDTARHQLVADDLRSLIETASTAIFGVDARGRALGLNWSFEKFITCWNGPAHNIQPTKQSKHSRTRQYNSIHTHTSHHITPSPYIILYPNPNTQKLDADLTTCCNCKHHKARCVFKTMCLCVCGGGTCEAMCWYAWMGHEQFRTGYVRRPYPAY
jgi:hypothetical protein